MTSPVIVASGLKSGYGPIPVLHDIDIRVHAGELVALLGPNGAGKTTTLLTIAGELPLMGGTVDLFGRRARGPLQRRAKSGLGLVTEERSVFARLSTRDNLRVGRVDIEAGFRLFPELADRRDTLAGDLSGGEQQMLTLARALLRSPKALLADELSLGLAPLVVDRLLRAVRRAADESGVGVLLVEQHVEEVLEFADRVYVVARGRVVFEGTVGQFRGRRDEIEAAYLGTPSEA
ncbi:MAG TPA: ABC transporter ATP-binding protein [Acidimicrobiia bacterium]|nr:ABC transporter ATP-binding protein [Acidimicrobiia bacterium]